MSRCIALIQARMSSSRLPGKVLAELGGRPMIEFMAQRVRRARRVDEVIVVTSTDTSDDPLCEALARAKVACFRGDLDDVLSRYVAAAAAAPADEYLRLTGDCPLIDPALIDAVVDLRRASGAPYASNVDPPSFPDGMDIECFTQATLHLADERASRGPEREHVTLWMRSAAAGLARANLAGLADLSHLRLTVDYADDLTVVREIVASLGETGARSDLYDILRVLAARPELLAANRHARNEGLARSLAQVAAEPGSNPTKLCEPGVPT